MTELHPLQEVDLDPRYLDNKPYTAVWVENSPLQNKPPTS